MSATLLVIDVLNDFANQHPPERRTALIRAINDLAALVRRCMGQVIWVRQEFAPDLHDAFLAMRRSGRLITIAGTSGAQIAQGLDVHPTEPVVVKKRYSAFHGTNLEALLPPPSEGVVIICGLNTHACVRMAAIDAYQRDYDVVVATDATSSYDEEQHASTLRYLAHSIARMKSNAEIATRLMELFENGATL